MNRSKKIGRGFGHTSILLLGSTGVGKSSTINHLFSPRTINGELAVDRRNFEFARTNAHVSETTCTTEYVLSVDNDKIGDKDISCRFAWIP